MKAISIRGLEPPVAEKLKTAAQKESKSVNQFVIETIKEKHNRDELDQFLDSPRVEVYAIDYETADFYAQILNNLRKNGMQIPTNDIWIAATAFKNGLKLYTKNSHFSKIPGINLL